MQWLRRSFITGLVVIVPLVISVVALVWAFRFIDGLTGPLFANLLGREVPGLGLATTALLVLVVGAIASNVIGRRVLQATERHLLRVPVFRSVYSPVKQLVAAFSPDNEYGLKRVVMVQDTHGRYVLGFLTRELTLDRGQGIEKLLAVYVPTNHLYLGDVLVVPADHVTYPDITVEEGVRIFLTGGMSLAERLHGRRADDRTKDLGV
jgi:uncharacterized membrane protein